MPVEWAIAQSDATFLDRFTARSRVPLSAFQQKPRGASAYALYVPDDDHAFLCRPALASSEGDSVIDEMVEISSVTRPELFKRVTTEHRFEVDGVQKMFWIPRTMIQDAGAITLELDLGSLDGRNTPPHTLLADPSYKQLLQEIMQHHMIVCGRAMVRLPLPNGLRQSGGSLKCRVLSTYPAVDFVRTTVNTRITIFLPDPIAIGGANGCSGDVSSVPGDASTLPTRVGGLDLELEALREMILLPIQNKALQQTYSVDFPKGALLCGPPGVGKTLLVRTAVEDCRSKAPLHLEVINGSEIMGSGIGGAEQSLRDIFQRAREQVRRYEGASVIFIDELDALCPKRDSNGSMAHSRVVAQLLTLLDGAEKHASENVLIIGATNLPNNIDPALRRPGRFDREIFVSPPDATARAKIFAVHMADIPYVVRGSEEEKSAFISILAQRSVGYVGADIAALCREALSIASTRQFVELTRNQELKLWWSDWKLRGRKLHVSDVEKMVASIAWSVNPVAIPVWFLRESSQVSKRSATKPVEYFRYLFQGLSHISYDSGVDCVSEESPPFEVNMQDFEQAMAVVVASALRSLSGVTNSVEEVSWDRIGGHEETKLALQQALEWPIKYPHTFSRLGITPPRGILLYGPPGCSKSTIVRAAASSSGATFLSLSAAQVFSPYFGDAEASVRQVFRDARSALPAIIFFDEIDVLVAKREFDSSSSSSASGSGSTGLRVLSTMLNEMDGVESAEGLLVIGATNRPDNIDAALLRPGRFDRALLVDLPTEQDRLHILEIHTRGMTLHSDVDLVQIVHQTDFFSGAELENVCREAGLHALRESINAKCVCMRHLVSAVKSITPISSPTSLETFFQFAARMGSTVGSLDKS